MEDRTLTKTIEAQRRARAKLREAGGSVPWARCGNLVLGIWLQVSIFTWPHNADSRISAWLPGLLIAIVALLALGVPPMRWLNAFLALWLIAWTFAATASEPLSYLNGVISGLSVLTLSAVSPRSADTE